MGKCFLISWRKHLPIYIRLDACAVWRVEPVDVSWPVISVWSMVVLVEDEWFVKTTSDLSA